MENYANIHSYDNVEKLQSELTGKDFEDYCKVKLDSAEGDTQFIKRHIYHNKPMDVCEIGSGNGKLLFKLEREKLLNSATGYEVSECRCNFAQKFQSFMDSKKSIIKNQNFLDDKGNNQKYDLIIAVDIVLQIVAPLYDKAEEETLLWIRSHLKDDGVLFLELEDYSGQMQQIKTKGGGVRFWEEFPEGDVFRYGLYNLRIDSDGNIVDDKLFLKRNSLEQDTFRNVIKSYSQEDIAKVLKRYGMNCKIYPYYDEYDQTPENQRKKLYRVLAEKENGDEA